jgi:hypothetical protein
VPFFLANSITTVPKGNFQRKTEVYYEDVCYKTAKVCTEEEVNTRFQSVALSGSQQVQEGGEAGGDAS